MRFKEISVLALVCLTARVSSAQDRPGKAAVISIQPISAMLTVVEKAQDKVNVFNLGTDEYCEIVNSIGWICEEMGVKPKLSYTGGMRGWIGDNPFIYLDTKKVRALGWKPQFSIEQGVRGTLTWLKANDWVYAERG